MGSGKTRRLTAQVVRLLALAASLMLAALVATLSVASTTAGASTATTYAGFNRLMRQVGFDLSNPVTIARPLTFDYVVHYNLGSGTGNEGLRNGILTGVAQVGGGGVTVNYAGAENDTIKQAQLIDAATAQRPDGIIVTLVDYAAFKDPIQRAVDAGIPVLCWDSGLTDWQKTGCFGFVGGDGYLGGTIAGQRLAATGAKNLVCINHQLNNVEIKSRCQGAIDGFTRDRADAKTNVVPVAGYIDLATTAAQVKAALLADPTIDAVQAADANVTLAAAQAVKETGSSALVGGFDTTVTSGGTVAAIKEGTIQFTVNGGHWTGAYMTVISMWEHLANGDSVGAGQQAVLSGPYVVDKSNVDRVADFISRGTW